MVNESLYKVLVVDDEAASIRYISNVITSKCPGFTVVDTAKNGKAALEKVGAVLPDVVISDVLMPFMNGIDLTAEIHRKYPSTLMVIVSGYNDFEYAKGAIASGCCDYLLKPVRPSDIISLMERLKKKLDEDYYEKRKFVLASIFRAIQETDVNHLKKYFPDEEYYGAIYRKNGLFSRFSEGMSKGIYSLPQEKIIVYGRDVMESLLLCPASLMQKQEFYDYVERTCRKNSPRDSFYTAVILDESFAPEEIPGAAKKLFRCLDQNVVIGKSQLLFYEECSHSNEQPEDQTSRDMLEYYLQKQKSKDIENEIEKIFKQWKQENRPQLWVEEKVIYMFLRCKEKGYIKKFDRELLEDIFAQSTSMDELANSVFLLLSPKELFVEKSVSEENDYLTIVKYLEQNLATEISIQVICKEFAISPTALNRMFRKFASTSFNVFLTKLRMEKAREMMYKNPEILIRVISGNVGYNDQFYFSRVFRSYYGCSPTEYMDEMIKRQES